MAQWVWQEELHPRAQKGMPGGGQFAHKTFGVEPAPYRSGGWQVDQADRIGIDTFRHYQSSDDAVAAIKSGELADGIDEIAHDAKTALQYYAAHGHHDINKILRAGIKPEGTIADIINNLDAMMRVSKLAEDTALYRVFGDEIYQKLAGLKPGDTITDSAFISTSVLPVGNRNRVKILAPAGSHALIIENSFGPHWMKENEVVLDRNSKLEYVGDEQDGVRVFMLRQDQRK